MDHVVSAQIMAAGGLCFRSRRVARSMTRLYDEALRPAGLQAAQLTLLNVVAHSIDEGMPMSRLAVFLALEISSLTRNLRPLKAAGLIGVDLKQDDRRVRVVRPTPAGQSRPVECLPLWQQAHAEVARLLGADVADGLKDRLDQAADALAAMDRSWRANGRATCDGGRCRGWNVSGRNCAF